MLKKHLVYTFVVALIACLCAYIFHWNGYVLLLFFFVFQVAGLIYFYDALDKANEQIANDLHYQLKNISSKSKNKDIQMAKMFEILPFPMMLFDTFGNIVLMNEYFKAFHYKNEIKKGETYLDNGFLIELQDYFKEAYILEKQFSSMIIINDVEYQISAVPIKIKGKFSGSLLYLQDISETLEGEKRQKRFIADASHEFKTPLAIIKGMIEILLRPDFDDVETQRDFLEQIANETNRLEGIVKDMLLLSKLSSPNVILEKNMYSIADAMDQALQPFIPMFKEKQIEIIKKFEDSSLYYFDVEKMKQVFINLYQNAYNHTDHGYIRLSTIKVLDGLLIKVEDSGCGIPDEHQSKIFERLYRVDSSRSRNAGGSGLGLAISKSIVEAHKGTISVESKEHQGSVFTIYLPAINMD